MGSAVTPDKNSFFSKQNLPDLVFWGMAIVLLFLNLGIRLVFLVYCMATGRDEDEIVTRSISAESSQECRGNEDRRSQSSATQETTCARRDPVE